MKQESDEEHPLSTNADTLNASQGEVFPCDRRTLYQDIAALNSYGYEVICRRGQHSNSYYVEGQEF